MKFIQLIKRRMRMVSLGLIASLTILFGWSLSIAQQSEDQASGIPVPTSVNALMVALVDHAAHAIWEAGYEEALTGRDWQTVEQHAIQLAASGTLISLGGTGVADRGWVMAPAWQELTQRMTDGALDALAAVENQNQQALSDAGTVIVEACEDCHEIFKPESPTEGIVHIPHYN